MAVWQFQLELISRAVAERHDISPGDQLEETRREQIHWWKDKALVSGPMEQLGKVLHRGKSWSEELEILGHLDETCVTILRDKGAIEEVRARLDLRTLSRESLEAILDFARTLGCLLVTDSNKVLDPTLTALADEIRGSPPYQFAKEPHAFLDEQRRREKGDLR